ncbi:chitin synthase 8 [Kalaharituber pfeilii]|nr:chitin synthase 8 [Kalaharituber pfeilii]
MANPPPQSQPDLAQLPNHLQSDTHITSHLASRFHLALPTATVSNNAIVSLNTYTTPSVVGVELENLAGRMTKRLSARAENQAVLFLGESGSGKTTLRSHLLSSILSFSSTPLSQKISLFAFLFDTLTTTKSVTTPTASKAGLFLELQYDGISSTLIGGKLLDHRLERSRVAGVPTGERNFHVLYYLLAGTSPAEKDHLGLHAPGNVSDGVGKSSSKRWRYLGHPTQLKVGINDADGFNHFKTALRKLEFPRTAIAEICQVLAAILHIGQLEFTISHNTHVDGEQSRAMEGGEEVVVVKNKDVLNIAAAFLGVPPEALETSLGYKTKTIHRERVTIMLDAKGARAHADELARTLYSLLVAWVIESGNERLSASEDSVANTISIIDFPGFAQTSATGSTLDQLLNNAATESLYNLCLQSFFERKAEQLESEEVEVPATSYFDNTDAVRGLLKPGNGLLAILDDQSKKGRTDQQFLESIRKRFDGNSNPAITASEATTTLPGSNFATANTKISFTVRHFAGEVDYPISGLLEDNGEVISGDLMNLFSGTSSSFVAELFSSKAVTAVHHPKERAAIMQGQISSKPLRMPSVMKKKGERPKPKEADKSRNEAVAMPDQGAAGQFVSALDTLTRSITATNTNPYFVFCVKPNDRRIANQFDSKCVRTQIRTLGIAEISQRVKSANFSVFLPFGEFLGLAEAENIIVGSEKEKAEVVVEDRGWPLNEARVGATGIFLSERCWLEIAGAGDMARAVERGYYEADEGGSNPLTPVGDIGSRGEGGLFGSDSRVRLIPSHGGPGLGTHIYGDTKGGYYSKGNSDDARSEAGASTFHHGDMFKNFDTRQQMQEKGAQAREQEIDEIPISGSRKRWMGVVWAVTFWVPTFLVKYIGRMKRPDIQVAWREKLAINILIWLACCFAIFILIFFPMLICPKQYVYSTEELASHDGGQNHDDGDAYVAIRGYVFDLNAFSIRHYPDVVPQKSILAYAGKDASNIFPLQVSALCDGVDPDGVDPRVVLSLQNENGTENKQIDKNYRYHDFRAWTQDPRKDWFYEQMIMLKGGYLKGDMGYSPKYVKQLASKKRLIFILNGNVYDLTEYGIGGRNWEPIEGMEGIPNTNYMDPAIITMVQTRSGEDVTKYWNALKMNDKLRKRMRICLDNLFYIGKVDTRNSTQCVFARYLLLAITIFLASILLFKFLAALQFTRKNMPENLDKFIMCQVPAYTEDEESLRRAIDSLARMKYDDKRKLLVVICDGMIIGQGNDKPTPRIVLDILGVPEGVDPEPLSFESLGEGLKQHNMGKVYSGLYEVQGHIVPFLVIVKVGKPSEVSKPGNRGKRDSQMVIMRFLNRVHYNLPMSPLELEMHHQIRNIIGVNPTFYEFLFQIDADTVVAQDAATRMVSAFLQDTRVIALCGETAIANAKHSFITMIQVYEYYISHNLAKAFESLFGSVTCLPGCFSMYRIRAAETGKPLFVSKEVVEAYAEIRVDTLHMKNLLHLGEDRYLTTLLLKHHPRYKTKYIFNAHAWTVAPDSWAIFLSQRRRWINSTVHNLMELIPMQQLCGFCCFSMRFVVFMDLFSTIIQPVTMAYLVYLVVSVILGSDIIPTTAFILLAAVYGLQAVIFIARRKWEMVAWMILYIIAIPDDFTWGNTRVVTGEKGQKVIISDEGKFDPASIPRKKWEDYQAELWEAQTVRGVDDTKSEASGYSYATKSYAPSEWGGQRAQSTVGLDVPLPPRGPSRISLAPSEMMSQRGSTFMGNHPMQAGEMEMRTLDLPSDDAILAEIREILRTADLMTVTKKSIKAELERKFGVSLDAKRAYVNSATEALLSGQL